MPHMSQTSIRIFADGAEQTHQRREAHWYDEHREIEVEIDGMKFSVGEACGDGCNCLIDSLRQVVLVGAVNVALVREQLESLHWGRGTRIVP